MLAHQAGGYNLEGTKLDGKRLLSLNYVNRLGLYKGYFIGG
jgi:hypothetical protein